VRRPERWLDVDLDEQVVVAHEGRRPVFATLASTGNKKWPTASGIYRIWLKFSETTMEGQMGDEQPYSVATVPWTMFFAKDLAFHTAYWHDRFGVPVSHGCVNLSPLDARALYEWASPDVPLGWTMSHGIFERPGSLVKIHSVAAPATEYRGYAKRVREEVASAETKAGGG
jgi:lipoprotein-anchoring transpeptidase ErfK/SrfK